MYYKYLAIAALLPVFILLLYIFNKDTEKEPVKELLIAFGFGMLSILASFMLSIPFGIMGLYTAECTTISEAIRHAFFAAAIPEEVAKFAMLWFFMRRTKEYDQYMDGIVYAVCVSLGFAAVENIIYVASNGMGTAIIRALTAVPAHYCMGVLMGYYYSMQRLGYHKLIKNRILMLLAPILLHGAYDALLFASNVFIQESSYLLMLVAIAIFIWLVFKMHKYCKKRIEEMIEQDKLDIALRDGGKEL